MWEESGKMKHLFRIIGEKNIANDVMIEAY